MIKLNVYITEAWSGVKKQSLKSNIEDWCEEMGIQNYTINSQGEIDVNGNVWVYKLLEKNDFKELPYKFGTVTGRFDVSSNKNLTSLKNCPYCPLCFFLKSVGLQSLYFLNSLFKWLSSVNPSSSTISLILISLCKSRLSTIFIL